MKLIFYKTIHRVIRRLASTLSRWEDELYWRVIYHTPVAPNPHPSETIEYHLHEEFNRTTAILQIRKRDSDHPSIWTALIEKSQWPDQMGETITTNPTPQ